jgi:hypothetical protein
MVMIVEGCGKSPIENAIEDLTDANADDDTDTDENDENDNDDAGDDNDDDTEKPVPSVTAKINDVEFEATTLISQSLTGAQVSMQPFGFALSVTGQYIAQDLKSIKLMSISIYGTDFDELNADSAFNILTNIAVPQAPGAFALYSEDPNVDLDDDEIGFFATEEIYVKITAIDKSSQLVSGEFNFVGIDDDTGERYEITDGVFTNLEYDIQ